MWNRHNVHKMFINIYRNPKTRNWFRYETFIHLFEFKGFPTWGERDTIFLSDFSICPKPRAAPAANYWSGLGGPRKSTFFLRGKNSALWLFLQSPKSSAHASGAWRHSHPLVTIPIWDFYFDISEWHILSSRAWTPALMLYLTNPCAKRKVLSLTKPKGKIYKTKSLGNYITHTVKWF